jgi:prepilin-type N-terminal cleavage/methylation domain-containing protein
MLSSPSPRNGFSLVELSIVLAIIGLLTGGILVGQSLIRSSQMQAVLTEYQNYKDAALAFRDQYDGLPGDLFDAANQWGTATNGNGNGQIEQAAAVSVAGEYAQFWLHLALSRQIQGNYTGLATATGVRHVQVGTNSPTSKMDNAGWSIIWVDSRTAASATYFDGIFGNQFTFGATAGTAENDGAVLKPEELWNLDKKIDDGVAGSGVVMTRKASAVANCAANDTTTSPYALTTSSKTCMAYFVPGF